MDRDRRISNGEQPQPGDYDNKTLYEIWQLAGLPENRRAFNRLTGEPWEPVINSSGQVAYRDRTLPGHSTSRFFYRIQAVSETGVLGDMSPPLQPVHCPLACKPEKLAINKHRLVEQNGEFDVSIFWRHIPLQQLNYYILYRTQIKDVAERKIWRHFENAVKVLGNQWSRPLIVEYGMVDMSNLPGGRGGDVLGIFRKAEFDTQGFDNSISFEDAAALLTNYYDNEVTLGRAKVKELKDYESVVCYYRVGTFERFVDQLAGEKMYVDHLQNTGEYYYCIASVDNKGNLSELSDPVRIRVK